MAVPFQAICQPNNLEYDERAAIRFLGIPNHFGIMLGLNFSSFKLIRNSNFTTDSIVYVVESSKGPGTNLGIIADIGIGKRLDIRFIPGISFAEKRLDYILYNDSSVSKIIESTYMNFPFLLKFKSDRINNFRMYVLGGIKFSIDMASNAEARNAPDQVKIVRNDLSFEYGVGYDYYFPMFKFSVEIKAAHGLNNILVPDNNLVYANVLDKLLSKGFMISILFE